MLDMKLLNIKKISLKVFQLVNSYKLFIYKYAYILYFLNCNYEQINAEKSDTDYYKKVDLFCNLIEGYCKLLNDKSKQEECIRICDIMLSRKIASKYRKKFDTIKVKASNVPCGDQGKKKQLLQKHQLKEKDNITCFFS